MSAVESEKFVVSKNVYITEKNIYTNLYVISKYKEKLSVNSQNSPLKTNI